MNIDGSVALVTGGSGGLGRSICVALADSGVSVAVGYLDGEERSAEVCETLKAAGAKAISVRIDQSDESSVQDVVAEVANTFGSLDILVNNAAMAKGVPFPDLEALSSEL